MPQANEAVWLPVLPSFKDFGPALIKGAGKDADGAGKKVGKRFGTAIVAGVAAIGVAGVAAGTALYKVGEVFDDVTDTIRVGTGASGEALDGLVDSAKRVGQNVPASFDQVGTTVADINTRMGLTGDTLETVASQYLEAGRILGEDVDIAKTSAAFNAFGIEGEAVVGAMDHLFQVSQATGVGMNDLATVVGVNAPAMKQLGFSFEETAVLAGELDKAGLDSNKMMAAMSKGMVTLAKDGEAPQEAFKRVVGEIQGFIASGDEAAALELAGKVFGTKGAPQFIDALASGRVNLDDLTKAAGQTSDSILDVGKETMDFAEAWQLFKNNVLVWLEPLGATVFGALGTWMGVAVDAVGAFTDAWNRADGSITQGGLLGFMEALAGKVREVYDWFQLSLIPALQTFGGWVQQNSSWVGLLAVTLGTAGAAVGVLVGAFKGWAAVTGAVTAAKAALTGGMAALNAVMRANPIGVVITVLTALVAAAIYAYTQFDWFRQVVDGAWNGIKVAAAAAWEGVIRPVFEAIGGWITGTLVPAFMHFWQGAVVPAWNGIVAAIAGAWNSYILPVLTALWGFIRDVLAPAMVRLWQGVFVPVWNGIVAAVQAAAGLISTIWNGIVGFVQTGFGPVMTWLRDAVFVPVWNGIVATVQTAGTVLQGIWTALVGALQTYLAPVFTWLRDAVFIPVWNGIVAAVQTAGTVLQGIWTSLVSVVQTYLAPVFTWLWQNVFVPVWNGISGVVQFAWGMLKAIFDLLVAVVRNVLAPAFLELWQTWVVPAWNGIVAAVQTAWAAISGIFTAVVATLRQVLGPAFTWLRDSVVLPVWNAISTAISTAWSAVRAVWDSLVGFIRGALSSAFTWLRDSVVKPVWEGIRTAITTAWDGAKATLDAAVTFIRGGFANAFTWLRDSLVRP
ncbi:phage tail tape measure protein, partial [Micrococcus lylae]